MFAIYGPSGAQFRGPLERLPAVRALHASVAARDVTDDGPEQRSDILAGALVFGAPLRVAREPATEQAQYAKAATAYRQTMQPKLERGPVLHAYQIMSRDVLAVRSEDSVASVWQLFATRRVCQAPVVGANLNVLGMVSERDLLTVLDLRNGQIEGQLSQAVSAVMVTPVVCADPATDIRRMAKVLLDTGLSALPVVSEAHVLVGIVSRGDILRAAMADPPLSLWA